MQIYIKNNQVLTYELLTATFQIKKFASPIPKTIRNKINAREF
jgi:hypothetical protein